MANFLDEIAWVPCMSASGKVMLTLHDFLMQADRVHDFAVAAPTKKASLWLSLCSWTASAVRRKGLDPRTYSFEDVAAYLKVHRGWFDADRFCQVPAYAQLSAKKAVLLSVLETELESGNNPNFFTKMDADRPKNYTAPEVALTLLQGHWYGLAGLGGGVGKENLSFTDCPASRCLVLVRKTENLEKMLRYNVDLLLRDAAVVADFVPAWERADGGADFLEEDKKLRPDVPLYLSFGLHRAFQVVWEGARARFLRRAKGAVVPELALIMCRMIAAQDREEVSVAGSRVLKVRADPKRAVWRDLHSILECLKMSQAVFDKPKRALVIEVFGMFTPSQAKIEGETGSVFHIPVEVVYDKKMREGLKEGLDLFDKGGRRLYATLRSGCEKAISQAKQKGDRDHVNKLLARSAAFDTYWDDCAVHFFGQLLPGLVTDRPAALGAAKQASNHFIRKAQNVFLSEFPKGSSWYRLAGYLQSRFMPTTKKQEVKL
ncbi:Type I-E CRISPR-associated protein Cse1/CasA [Acanthopleuribacter pedis]|uniref:Type I-E CRISPR-associated protein Cse1/CasA n=1 Tax=Acanthopleuribacter pedis TaxID=442870 RepID=A0A8J7U6Z5_9BACT|nr:type I-E CRISPR-associated protein Cse1/CasA [Acanthopleuribacter pedis]